MKKWNFKVKSNIQEITKKLDAAFGSSNRFVFNIENDKNDSATFKVRKRGLYAFYLLYTNKIVVEGNMLKTNTDNETHVEISFSQYFLWKFILFANVFLGLGCLIALLSETNDSTLIFIPTGILLITGFVIFNAVQKKFKKDIEEYKTLISKILKF